MSKFQNLSSWKILNIYSILSFVETINMDFKIFDNGTWIKVQIHEISVNLIT